MADHRYLLDTNILSDLIKHPSGAVAHRIAAVGEDVVCTSIVVACELRYGAAKRGSPALSGKIGQFPEDRLRYDVSAIGNFVAKLPRNSFRHLRSEDGI